MQIRALAMWGLVGLLVLGCVDAVLADVTCANCGTIVHTNGPTTCPVCGRTIPAAGQPGPQAPPYPPNLSPFPRPQPPVPYPGFDSGFKLGVRVIPMSWGLRVHSVEHGSPAHRVLYRDDIMQQAAYRDDAGVVQRFSLRMPQDLETVKHYVGSSKRVAMQVRRPTGEMRFLFVTFAPKSGGPVRMYAATPGDATGAGTVPPAAEGTAGVTVDTTGEAAAMFAGPAAAPDAPVSPTPAGTPPNTPDESAEDLFQRP